MTLRYLVLAMAVPVWAQTAAPAVKLPTGPPARIASFTAEPASVRAGEKAMLRWEAFNSATTTIEPGLGVVNVRGSREVVPTVTTTYTITTNGTNGKLSKSVTVTVAGSAGRTAAAPVKKVLPRIGGKPDLSGVYQGGRDIVPQGQPPLKAGAESMRVPAREDDLGQGAQCLPPHALGATQMPYPLQIVQRPDTVVIIYEAYNLFRIIPIGKPHPEDMELTWMGNSVGRWEGDTLVVDVAGLNDKTLVGGFRHSDQMHIIERYTRQPDGAIAYEATVEDPALLAAPWKFAGKFTPHPEWDIQEYVCTENNKDYKELYKK